MADNFPLGLVFSTVLYRRVQLQTEAELNVFVSTHLKRRFDSSDPRDEYNIFVRDEREKEQRALAQIHVKLAAAETKLQGFVTEQQKQAEKQTEKR